MGGGKHALLTRRKWGGAGTGVIGIKSGTGVCDMDEVMEQQEEEREGLGETAPGRRCWAGGRGKVTRGDVARAWSQGVGGLRAASSPQSRTWRSASLALCGQQVGCLPITASKEVQPPWAEANMAEHLRASVWGRQRNRLLVAGGRPSVWQVCPWSTAPCPCLRTPGWSTGPGGHEAGPDTGR